MLPKGHAQPPRCKTYGYLLRKRIEPGAAATGLVLIVVHPPLAFLAFSPACPQAPRAPAPLEACAPVLVAGPSPTAAEYRPWSRQSGSRPNRGGRPVRGRRVRLGGRGLPPPSSMARSRRRH